MRGFYGLPKRVECNEVRILHAPIAARKETRYHLTSSKVVLADSQDADVGGIQSDGGDPGVGSSQGRKSFILLAKENAEHVVKVGKQNTIPWTLGASSA